MKIFHIATAADWSAARDDGQYTTSTRGRSLQEVGYIHAARREQVSKVFAEHYRDAGEPLVLLTVDTTRLTVPVRDDAVGSEVFPHIYGPLDVTAVVDVQPLDRRGSTPSFTKLFFGDMVYRIMLVLVAMFLSFLGAFLGRMVDPEWGEFLGALIGLGIGVGALVLVLRRT